MTQEEKQLLLKDLCARLPYGVKVKITEEGILSYDSGIGVIVGKEHVDNEIFIIQCKNDSWCLTAISEFVPYLRQMSSMSSKEWVEFCDCSLKDETSWVITSNSQKFIPVQNREDYLNSKHFDYRGLIEKGLALEAPEDMYPKNTKDYGSDNN